MLKKIIKNVHWIKWRTKETIYGSFMTEPVEALGFMVKLCCFSAETRYPGYVQSEYQKGIPHIQLASLLNVPIEMFESLLALHKAGGRIEENGSGVIRIVNWGKYQSIPAFSGSPEDIARFEQEESQALAELKAGGVNIKESPKVKEIDIVYGAGGEIDENKSILFGMSLFSIRQSLKGERDCLPANLKRYRETLAKLGIPFEEK